MSQAAPNRPAARTAAEVARLLDLSPAAQAALSPGQTPRQYLDALLLLSRCDDALRFLAAALPKREAVWWACLCLREALPGPLEGPALTAVEAAEQWVVDPREANRRSAQGAAAAVGWGTAPGCAAAAAFWSGGSLAPPQAPVVPPREDLTGRAVAAALFLAAAADPARAGERHQHFLKIGTDVAAGGRRWERSARG